MSLNTIKPLSEKRWSGGGDILFANVNVAMETKPEKFSDSGTPVVFKNVVPLKHLVSGDFIYIPQNAWAWYGPTKTAKEFIRRSTLRVCSLVAKARAKKLVRIGPMIPSSKNATGSFLPNALDEDFDNSIPGTSEAGASECDDYYVVPGSIWGYRNLEMLIEAYAAYSKRSASHKKVIIVGPCSQPRYFESLEQLCDGVEGIELLGKKMSRTELLSVIAGARLCIFPSLVEASPVTVLEAAALNTAIVAMDTLAYRFIESELAGAKIEYFKSAIELTELLSNPTEASYSLLQESQYREQKRSEWVSSFIQACCD